MISTADLLAYYSIRNSNLGCLYPYSGFSYNDDYFNYLMDVSEYLSPIVITLPITQTVEMSPVITGWGDVTLGITPSYYTFGLERYCNNCGVNVDIHRATQWTDSHLKTMMIDAYNCDCIPVLFMGYGAYVAYYDNKQQNEDDAHSYDYHWVNVLGVEVDENMGETYLYVATWGQIKILKLSDIIGLCPDGCPNYLRSMVYYYECQA